MSDKKSNVFISHRFHDEERRKRLTEILQKAGRSVRDSSINEADKEKPEGVNRIKTELSSRIKWAGTLVVLITSTTHQSDWVKWEIEEAERQGTRIVGVYDYNDKESKLPDALHKYADAIIGWNSNNIIKAIDGEINNREDGNGNNTSNISIYRHGC